MTNSLAREILKGTIMFELTRVISRDATADQAVDAIVVQWLKTIDDAVVTGRLDAQQTIAQCPHSDVRSVLGVKGDDGLTVFGASTIAKNEPGWCRACGALWARNNLGGWDWLPPLVGYPISTSEDSTHDD